MIEIAVSNVKKNFGFKNVFDGFDCEAFTGEKIGLIGQNGCGKTTLFKLITKRENPDSGTITIRKGAKIGLLAQMPFFHQQNMSVQDFLNRNFEEIYEIENKLKKMENQMSLLSGQDLEKVLNQYADLQQKFIDLDGYMTETKINEICNKFRIDEALLKRKVSDLSGGESTLISLASIMLSDPDILLLDEPTNNLDIDTLEWLEEYLKSYSGTIIISSHDRYFLDQVTTKTVLIEQGKSEIFNGNYTYYLKENERRILSEFEQYKNQQKMIEAMKRKIKQLQEFGRLAAPSGESFFKRAASIQKRLDKIELLKKPEEQKEIPLNFKMDSRSGNQVLLVNNLDLDVPSKQLLYNANFNIFFKDIVCLMGKNGCGKSTLIKHIIQLYNSDNKSSDESIKIGSNVLVGYIPQVIEFNDENETILSYVRKFYDGTETHLRASLTKFLFNGDDVFKRVGKLSGGEKVRIKLFELMQKNVNFLIMDEPTNHIDITTKEVLESSLKNFPGTILFISHDRYFINELAQKILYVEDKKIREYLGNYDYYKEQKQKKLVYSENNSQSRKK